MMEENRGHPGTLPDQPAPDSQQITNEEGFSLFVDLMKRLKLGNWDFECQINGSFFDKCDIVLHAWMLPFAESGGSAEGVTAQVDGESRGEPK